MNSLQLCMIAFSAMLAPCARLITFYSVLFMMISPGCWDSVVNIATVYGMDDRWVGVHFLFSTS
jgi:hypothetical protein